MYYIYSQAMHTKTLKQCALICCGRKAKSCQIHSIWYILYLYRLVGNQAHVMAS